jgi:geranylgeranyl pyrophosphate synthase
MQVIERKTATLFEAATRIGAVLAGADADTEARCARYGAALGKAFQIIDDVLDYSGHVEDLGKQLGDDLKEGKATLPLIHALSVAPAHERALIESAIRDGGGDFLAIARIVQDSGSLHYAQRIAENEARLAREAVAKGARVLWMQLGIRNEAAARIASDAGLDVVMDRCMKIEHARILGGLNWAGVNTGIVSARRARVPR